MVGEAIQSLQQQLLYAGNYKAVISTHSSEIIRVFKRSFYNTFDIDDLIKLISEHIIGYQIISVLLGKEELQKLSNDSIFQAFQTIIEDLQEDEVIEKSYKQIEKNIEQLLSEVNSKEKLFTQLMGREEGEPLPDYFLGMFRSLMRKHLNNSGKYAQYLYPSFTLPPFLDTDAKSNTIVCYDLLVYYWSALIIPESIRSFGNSLSFIDIQPQGQKHLDFTEEDANLNKLVNLNRDPVQIVFGTIQQMSLGNRTAHKHWVQKVKKTFKSDTKRNPMSYWFLWAKERLGNNGILVIRGDHSLAAAPEYKEWRKVVSTSCQRVYIQSQQYSSQVIYCFIFNDEEKNEGVFFAPSYLEDFAPIHEDSDDWITLSSDEYKNFLCLISDKEKSIFNQNLPTIEVKNKSWFTDFNKKQLETKVNSYISNQKKAETLALNTDDNTPYQFFKVNNKPFSNKWLYVSSMDKKNWGLIHRYGTKNNNPIIAISVHKEVGLEIVPAISPIINTFYDRKQSSTILPLYLYKEDQSSSFNISDWALDRFKQYYISRLPKVKQDNTVELIQEVLAEELKVIKRHTSQLPVLDKYRKQIDSALEEKENPLESITKPLHLLHQKMMQLYRSSTQKRRMVQEVSQASDKIIASIQTIEKEKIENESKIKQLSKDNIFYYCFAILNHPLYKIDYDKELKALPPRIPLLNDFWTWAKYGKEIFSAGTSEQSTIHFQLNEIAEEIDDSDLIINASQKIEGLTESDLIGEWNNDKILHLILKGYKERKHLNKGLQKFYHHEIPVLNRLDLMKSIQLQSQYFNVVKTVLPKQLFENTGQGIRLKRRKV